jgi:peptide/nickel transport system substrate-binding protein
MKRVCFALVFFALPLFSARFIVAAETPVYGGRLTFGIRSDLTSLNPFFRTQSTNINARELAYETLLDTDKSRKLIPALAESWKVSPDGKSYTFRLRKGVKFHNGQEMTAEDVKWSMEYAMDPRNGATGQVPLKKVQTVNVRDRLTIEILLHKPDAIFLSQVSSIRLFPVVPKESISPEKGPLLSVPPGTGPFILKEHRSAREIVFVRHKDYWQKGVPFLDEVVFKPGLEDTVQFASLRAGDLDIIERTPSSVVNDLVKDKFPGLGASFAKYASYRSLLFNTASPPFNNVKLRHAVLYALDKQQFLAGAFWGLGEPADQLMPKESPWHVKLPEVKRDVGKVQMLLKEAGVGSDFQVELLGLKEEQEELQVLQHLLNSAGIKTTVAVLERAARVAREKSGDFMVILRGSNIPNDPGELLAPRFGCNEEEVRTKKRGENSSGFCNREFDRLVEEAGRILDAKRRYELYAKATRIIYNELPDISLVRVPRPYTHRQKVRDFHTDWDGRFNMTTGGVSRVWISPSGN